MKTTGLYLCLFLIAGIGSVLGQFNFECTSDSDCLLSGYHCCKGTIYCCADGFICTGGATCISIGVIIGPVVAFVVIAVVVGVLIWYKRCRGR